MNLTTVVATLAVIATTTAAGARDWRAERIDERRAEQTDRIRHDRRAGELTLAEKWRLQAEQRHVARMQRDARRDGYISAEETRRISAAQNRAGRHIWSESHDAQKSWWRRW